MIFIFFLHWFVELAESCSANPFCVKPPNRASIWCCMGSPVLGLTFCGWGSTRAHTHQLVSSCESCSVLNARNAEMLWGKNDPGLGKPFSFFVCLSIKMIKPKPSVSLSLTIFSNDFQICKDTKYVPQTVFYSDESSH